MVNTTPPRTPAEMFRLYMPGDPPLDGCWLWTGPLTRKGYGDISCGGRQARIRRHAHRVSYEIYVGKIAPGKLIRHVVCDNPPCCQPSHLLPGNPVDNMNDMMLKGRCGTAHLTEVEVRAIRAIYRSGQHTMTSLADRFGVGRTAIGNIVYGRTWKHLP